MKQGKVVLLILVVSGLFGYWIGSSDVIDQYLPDPDDVSLWMLVFVFLGPYLAILIHELGHLLTGLFYGFKFQLFIVGFLGIRKKPDGQIKVYFNKDISTFGGIAATSPTTYDDNTIDQFAKMILAGPIISLLWGALSLTLMLYFNYPLKFLFVISGFTSFLIFLGVVIPSKSGAMYSDRKRYQRLKSKGKEQDIEHAFMKAFTLKISGESIDVMPYDELSLITSDASPLFQYIGYLYMFEHKEADESRKASLLKSMTSLNDQLPKFYVQTFSKELERLTA